jgi:hypothetical protein
MMKGCLNHAQDSFLSLTLKAWEEDDGLLLVVMSALICMCLSVCLCAFVRVWGLVKWILCCEVCGVCVKPIQGRRPCFLTFIGRDEDGKPVYYVMTCLFA